MNIVEKDILAIERGIIAHQVNCMGVWGAGLAKEMKEKFPTAFEYYRAVLAAQKADAGAYFQLGRNAISKVENNLFVCSMFAQYDYGKVGRYTEYSALVSCLRDLNKESYLKDLPAYIPHWIGCGLGGGDWSVVADIIEKTFPEVIICKKP